MRFRNLWEYKRTIDAMERMMNNIVKAVAMGA